MSTENCFQTEASFSLALHAYRSWSSQNVMIANIYYISRCMSV